MEQPYISISILDSVEPESAYVDILQKIAARSEKFKGIKIEFGQEELLGKAVRPNMCITFPSYEKFLQIYEYKTQIFSKALEDIQDHQYDYDSLFSQAFDTAVQSKSNSVHEGKIYLSLKYQTNYQVPLVKYYQYSNRVGTYLGSQFYIEEIADGFLIFYQRKEDFIAHQVDRLNLAAIIRWFEQRGISKEHPSVQILLQHLQKIKDELLQSEFIE
ncbi:MAG: hypothetical protein ACTSYI_09805 [Promethearchaeota archaeon]